MFDPRFPWLGIGAITVFLTGLMGYYIAVLGGWYKDPLMRHFRSYGAERRASPLPRLLIVFGWWCLLATSMLDSLVRANQFETLAPGRVILLGLMVMAWAAALVIRRRPALREALPRWYADLLRDATRQERRFIGYAWLRIPDGMRWRLNSDSAAFQTWADTVRITVTYGARDPDDPWAKWT
jgi:hypothetical protein